MTTLTSICYHYLARDDEFRRIWGHTFELFKEHIKFFKKNYTFINPNDVLKQKFEEDKNYILPTFDDGLAEHVKISRYLDELGIKGIFAIPTSILRGEPSNPQIIHFGGAYYGIRKFYNFVAEEINNSFPNYSGLLLENPGAVELMQLLKLIKDIIKRKIDHKTGRKILMEIFSKHLSKDFPDFTELVHLRKQDIIDLVKRGHSLASHSDTHPVFKDIMNDAELMRKEIAQSKADLSNLIGEEIEIFAYPFGEAPDVLENTDYFTQSGYKMVLTTYQDAEKFNPLNLGRYCSQSKDELDTLTRKLWKYKVI